MMDPTTHRHKGLLSYQGQKEKYMELFKYQNGECSEETKMLINIIPHKWLWTLIHDRINTEVCICFFSNFL